VAVLATTINPRKVKRGSALFPAKDRLTAGPLPFRWTSFGVGGPLWPGSLADY
jgi:hypothetical protein